MEHLRLKRENQGLIAASLRVVYWLKFALTLLIITEVFLTCVNVINSFDFPWQLAEGNRLLDSGRADQSVLNAYGEISPHFENEYILYELLIAGINRATGWVGLSIFFCLLAFLIYLPCLLAFFKARHRFVLIDICLFVLAQFLVNMRLSARPELVADICYVLTGMMLMSWPGRSWTGAQILTLGLIFCLWANAHGTFLLGLAMLGLWYGQLALFQWRDILAGRELKWLLPGIAAVIGCAVNPFGFYRIIQPFQLHSLLWGQGTSLEMAPVTGGVMLLPVIWSGAAIVVLLLRARDRKFYWMIAMLLLLQYLTFTSIRYNMFIGLTLLVVAWDGLRHPRETFMPSFLQLSFSMVRLSVYFCLVLLFANTTRSLVGSKAGMLRDYFQNIYPKTRLPSSSSCTWMREHPSHKYYLLSYLAAGSWAQMPGIHGIHPLIDSGTHRYSDRTNQLYYYSFSSPRTFRTILSRLNINAIAVNNSNIYWAETINTDPHWQLVQVADDSQLYLRKDSGHQDPDPHLFADWDKKSGSGDPADVSSNTIIRGLGLRSDADSLRMLTGSSDTLWTGDPQIVYLKDWLNRVPDHLIVESLQRVKGRMDNSSIALQILFSIRLHHEREAAELARQWHPRVLQMEYQDLEMLRAEAFLDAGDTAAARAILDSFRPKPRFSLRWARLCSQIYGNDLQSMPKNARLLIQVADQREWQNDIIEVLNQNIRRLSP